MNMKANTYHRNDRRRPANRFYCNPSTTERTNKFEFKLNRFFYRLFGGLALFILFAAIYEQAWHQLLTAGITGLMALVIYDQNKKNKR